MTTALASLPSSLTAGDSVDVRLSLSQYPASQGWALRVDIAGPGAVTPWQSEADGDAHLFALASTATTAYVAGEYAYQLCAVNADRRVTLERGALRVLPNLAAITGTYDGRSKARQVLDAIDARLLGRATQDQMSLSVAGRTIQRTSLPDLLALRDAMKKQVAKEEGRLKSKNIYVKYGR